MLIESTSSNQTPPILTLPNEILSRIFAFATQPDVTTGSGYHRSNAEHNIQLLEDAHSEFKALARTAHFSHNAYVLAFALGSDICVINGRNYAVSDPVAIVDRRWTTFVESDFLYDNTRHLIVDLSKLDIDDVCGWTVRAIALALGNCTAITKVSVLIGSIEDQAFLASLLKLEPIIRAAEMRRNIKIRVSFKESRPAQTPSSTAL